MYELEIILVNDNSKDNSIKIIQNMQKEDKRIKIINNKKNMGTLYSRCIGVLKSKGKYIFPLDNDDMFFDNDIFNVIYKEAINNNYDIVGFKHIQSNYYNITIKEMKEGCHMYNNEFIVYQPQLSLFGISEKEKLKVRDVHIWSKGIKCSLYQTAVNALGIKKYSLFISWYEDTLMVFILFNLAKSYRYITKYGIFRFNRKISSSNITPLSNILLGEIFFLDIIFDFTKKDLKNKKYAVLKAIQLRNHISSRSMNLINKKYLIIVLKKIFDCIYISKSDKEILKKLYNSIL